MRVGSFEIRSLNFGLYRVDLALVMVDLLD